MTEPKAIEVEQCEDCPARSSTGWDWICGLEDKFIDGYSNEPPDWCPLRTADVVLRLKR